MAVPGDTLSPPPGVQATTPQRTLRPHVGSAIAFMSGVGIVLMTFLPWLSSPLGDDLSGWNLYDAARDAGGNPLFTREFFVDRFSPFLTGLGGVISGVLMVGAALTVLLAPKIPQPARSMVPKAWGVPAMLVAFVAAMLSLVGLYTLTIAQPAPRLIDPGVGLILWLVIGYIGFIALVIACAGTAARKPRG